LTKLYNPNLKLSANFKLGEVFDSAYALAHGIDNLPSNDSDYLSVCDKAAALVAHVLQPIRDKWGPVVIDSWYRCMTLNAAVGGAQTSAHLTGEAADCLFDNIEEVYSWIAASGLPFDQAIAERRWHVDHWARWVHLAHKRDNSNRGHTLISLTAGNYQPFTPERLDRFMLES